MLGFLREFMLSQATCLLSSYWKDCNNCSYRFLGAKTYPPIWRFTAEQN